VVILPTISEPVVEEIEEEPEPEPVAPPFIFVPPPPKKPKVLESKPLSEEELEEALS
jgi:hypothetical protein